MEDEELAQQVNGVEESLPSPNKPNGFPEKDPNPTLLEQEDVRKKNQADDTVNLLNQEIQALMRDRSELQSRLEELQVEADRSEEEKKAVLTAIAAQASNLEGEVSRLQHDLGSVMSAFDDAQAEVQDLKRTVEELKSDKALLLDSKADMEIRIRELEGKIVESEKREASLIARREEAVVAVSERDEEIVKLRRELEVLGSKGRALEEKLRVSEEEAKEKMEEEVKKRDLRVKYLETAVKELEEKNSDLEGKVDGYNNSRELVEEEEEKANKGYKISWPVAAASTGTVALAGAMIYLRYGRQG